jgi:hypothetical protein
MNGQPGGKQDTGIGHDLPHEENCSGEQWSFCDAENELQSPEACCICACEGGSGDTRPEESSDRQIDARRHTSDEHV